MSKKSDHYHFRTKERTIAALDQLNGESDPDENGMFEMEERQMWERLPHENLSAFSNFVVYRDMGAERSLARVATMVKKPLPNVYNYASVYRWNVRAAKYDEHLSKIRERIKIKKIKEMEERHAKHLQATETSLMVVIQEIISRVNAKDLGDLKVMEMSELIKLANNVAGTLPKIVQTERLSMGVATGIAKTDVTSDGKSLAVDFDEFKAKMVDVVTHSPADVKEKFLQTLDEMAND